jgi:3-oxoacyl-[acyl-carrier protein] reductase
MQPLLGRNALVTGGSRGIGRAIAIALGEAGARVAIGFRKDASAAAEALHELEICGGHGMVVGGDVSRAFEVERMLAEVERGLGKVDVLVNNAGVSRPLTIDGLTEAAWDETLTTNLKSVFLVTQAVLPKMREQKWGRIINLSSTAAQVGGVVGPHYAASKAGIIGLTHAYAAQLAREGITCNAIAPALIETEMVTSNPRASPSLIPIGRFGAPAEVAGVAVLLATNAYITGQTINVNGGVYLSS